VLFVLVYRLLDLEVQVVIDIDASNRSVRWSRDVELICCEGQEVIVLCQGWLVWCRGMGYSE